MSQLRSSAAKSRNLAGESRPISQHQLAVGRAIWAVIEHHVQIRLRLEDQCSALNNRAPAARHNVKDLQYAAVGRFQHTVIGDGHTGIEDKSAASNIGVDSAMRVVDQGQSAVTSADPTRAANSVVDV